MRNAVYSLLKDDSDLKELGVSRVYASPGLDTPQENLFVILRWQSRNREFAFVGTQDLQVWVHNRESDYNVINKILERIKQLLCNTHHRQGSDGTFVQAYWTGDSEDFRDDGFRTYTRNSGYRCNGGMNVEG